MAFITAPVPPPAAPVANPPLPPADPPLPPPPPSPPILVTAHIIVPCENTLTRGLFECAAWQGRGKKKMTNMGVGFHKLSESSMSNSYALCL